MSFSSEISQILLLVCCMVYFEFIINVINEIFASIIFSNYCCLYPENLLISLYINLLLSFFIICYSFSFDSDFCQVYNYIICKFWLLYLLSIFIFYFLSCLTASWSNFENIISFFTRQTGKLLKCMVNKFKINV